MARRTSRDAILSSLLAGASKSIPPPAWTASESGERLTAWLDLSRSFAAFAAANRDKIRKKLRVAPAGDGARDVLAELAVAFLLLQERHLELAYEPLAAQGRGPDFGVRFRTSGAFYLEVTRLRLERTACAAPDDLPLKLATRICTKLRQLPAGASNVLVVVADAQGEAAGPAESTAEPTVGGTADITALLLTRAIGLLMTHAQRGDDAFFQRRGLSGRRDFGRLFGRLSGGLLLAGGFPSCGISHRASATRTSADAERYMWENKTSRHPLSPELRSLLRRLASRG